MRMLVIAPWLLLSSTLAHAEPLRIDVDLDLAWSRADDSTRTPVRGGETASSAAMALLGVGATVLPYRDLVVDARFERGGTELDTPQVVPSSTAVDWTRMGLAAGWRFAVGDLGPIADVRADALAGWTRARLHAAAQAPTQLTPSFTHHELGLGGRGLGRVGRVELEARAALVPFVVVGEQHATNGSGSYGWGFDLGAAARYDLGALLGPAGSLLVGVDTGFGARFVGYDGEGTRRSIVTGAPVTDVGETFRRLALVAQLVWRFPGGGGEAPASVATPMPAPAPALTPSPLAVASGAAEPASQDDDDRDEAKVVGREIVIKNRVQFREGSAVIDMARSRRVLVAVSRILQQNPTLAVEVRGHTDNRGEGRNNIGLSQERAAAVLEALVGLGVARARLAARGFGDTLPIASNASADGRARNRRVEFKIR